jgi:TolB-like protein/class 3 adenylate cyclase/Tfp pilus assembly protein PilF
MERRLTTVLIADVAGYGRLSQTDEEGTRARFLADLNEVFAPALKEHHGRLVKTMGDGLLIEFHSVVDALRCATGVQRAEAERNTGLLGERRLDFRIGINLGDVIVEGDDIHGDGVNIADRLQGLAEPGGIAISGTAYDQVKGKLAVGYADLGAKQVKNIAEAVRVYRVLLDPAATGTTIAAERKASRSWRWSAFGGSVLLLLLGGSAVAWWRPWEPSFKPELPLPDKPSIAVLPFTNMSGDPQQEYFADGMTDDLITDLSQISGLFVIARNSTFAYKGKTVDPRQVAQELGVRYVLEGSVQRAGAALRINAQLIDATTNGHQWADRYDGSLADVFALQDKVTRSIADSLALRLSPLEEQSLARQETAVPAAYDAFLRGWEHYRRATADDFAKSIPYFEAAIKLDPGYSRANAALAMVYLLAYDRKWSDSLGIAPWVAFQKAQQYLTEAQKHPTSISHQVAGNYWRDGNEGFAGIAEFKRAIALDPSDSWSYAYLAWGQIDAGQSADARTNIETAMRLDPHYPSVFVHILGLVQLGSAQFDAATESLERASRLNSEDEYTFLALGAAYGYLGRKPEALSAVARYNDIVVKRGGTPLTVSTAPRLAFTKYGPNAILKKGLRLAGVPEKLLGSEFAARNQLTPDDVRTHFFGHQLHGRTLETGDEHAAAFTANGSATISGDWGSLAGAIMSFDDGDVCFVDPGGARFCATLLRNPGGSNLRENEFIWLDGTGAYPFSLAQ